MLEEIKKELIEHPEKLRNVLEHFGYCNIVVRPKYIQFGRDSESSKKSIVIKLENNRYLYVNDYPRNINQDMFSYIISQRHVEFKDVLNAVKKELGISDYYEYFNKRGIFGGFYEHVRKKSVCKEKIYDESVLDQYQHICNLRFLQDNISLGAQKKFEIGYDIEAQGITIPIRNPYGQLMGVKERFNYEVPDGEMKYFYAEPCQMSLTLYGYYQNYEYLTGGVILIFEAEKSVLQCYSYGIRNCVALGSGTVSSKQVQLLLELNPHRVIFMHDVGYKYEYIERNIRMVQAYSRFAEIEIGYWDFFDKDYPNKSSPSDLGKERLYYILENEIKMIGDGRDEEEL